MAVKMMTGMETIEYPCTPCPDSRKLITAYSKLGYGSEKPGSNGRFDQPRKAPRDRSNQELPGAVGFGLQVGHETR